MQLLLNQTKDRRLSFIEDNPDNTEAVEDPWTIASAAQLFSSTAVDSTGVFEMLTSLRKERDFFRTNSEQLQATIAANAELTDQLDEVTNQLYEAQRKPVGSPELRKEVSKKVPDPPVFTGTDDPSWDSWLSQMDNKLDVNGDWYPNASSKITYVLSRLGGKPDRQTMNRRIRGCTNPYTSHEEIIEELADIYEDSDRKNNLGRQLDALQMSND